MVSTFHFKILDLASSRSKASDAEGFGTIRCRHKKYQPYIQIITAIGSINTIEPNISTIFFVRNLFFLLPISNQSSNSDLMTKTSETETGRGRFKMP